MGIKKISPLSFRGLFAYWDYMTDSNFDSFDCFELLSDCFFAFRRSGGILYMNEAARRLVNEISDDTHFINIDDLFVLKDADQGVSLAIKNTKQANSPLRISLPLKPGNTHLVGEMVISGTIYNDEAIYTAVLRIIDGHFPDRIFENEEVFMSDVFQVSGALFMTTDRKGVILSVNTACENLSEYSMAELKGRSIFDILIPSSEVDIVRARFNSLSEQNKSNTSVNSWVTKFGEVRVISWSNTIYKKNSGQEYIVSTGIDITDQKRVEESLKKSEERLTLALEASNHGLWDVNLKKKEVYFSQSYYRMLGYDPENFSFDFDTWRSLVNPYDLPMVDQFFNGGLLKPTEPFEVEFRMKTMDGTWKWFLAWGRIVEVNRDGSPVRLTGIFTDYSQRKKVEESLRLNEARLRAENVRLRGSIKERFRFGNIIGKSPLMQKVYEVILQAANSSAPVIIHGESGTGKELVARAIHDMGERSKAPFVVVNCGAIPENLIESEFFGYRKGAFSGAVRDNPGFIEQADQGSLFLDEIGEIGLGMQVKLLRAIEGGGFTPIGSNDVKHSNFRIIAATNRDLSELVKQGKMRKDFFYRINVIPVNIPPLRERVEDIPLLVQFFIDKFRDDDEEDIPDHYISAMKKYVWPGNVRELQNAVHRYITLKSFDIPAIGSYSGDVPGSAELLSLFSGDNYKDASRKFEKVFLKGALDMHAGNRTHAAKYLDMERRTLLRKLKELGID